MSYTDPTRTIMTWHEFGTTVASKVTEIGLTPISTEEELERQLLMLEAELLELFEEFLWLMMTRAVMFAVEHMNRVSPEHYFASEWTPADEALLDELMKGCRKYLTDWTEDIRKEAARVIRESAGLSPAEIGARVSQVLEANKNRGILIARTELMRAFNKTAERRYRNAGFKMRWLTARDPKVCEICNPLDGKLVPEETKLTPPAHPLCRCTIVPEVEK